MKKILFISLLSLLFLTACDSKEQKEKNAAFEEKASENAIDYIYEKYGFNAEVVSAKINRQRGMFGSTPLSDVLVNMNYGDKDFQVYITGEESSKNGCDSYQADEIEEAFFEFIDEHITGLQKLSLNDKRDTSTTIEFEKPLYSVYYDGNNLNEVLQDGTEDFCASYLNTDLSDEADFSFLEPYFSDSQSYWKGSFYSWRSEDYFNFNMASFSREVPLYYDSRRTIKSNSSDYKSFELKKYENLLYCIMKIDSESNVPPEIKFRKLSEDDEQYPSASAFVGHGTGKNSVIATDVYQVTANQNVNLVVYYPIADIANFDYDGYMHNDTRAATVIERNGEPRYSAGSVQALKDYIEFDFSLNTDEDSPIFLCLYSPD